MKMLIFAVELIIDLLQLWCCDVLDKASSCLKGHVTVSHDEPVESVSKKLSTVPLVIHF